jgi:hypothetical protein
MVERQICIAKNTPYLCFCLMRRIVSPRDKSPQWPLHCFVGRTQLPSTPEHWHAGLEIITVFSGVMEHRVGDHSWQLHSGDCLLIGGSAAHSERMPKPCHCAIWQLEPCFAQELARGLPASLKMPPTRHDSAGAPWPPRHVHAPDLRLMRQCAERVRYELEAVS